jgi:hypothetical protein
MLFGGLHGVPEGGSPDSASIAASDAASLAASFCASAPVSVIVVSAGPESAGGAIMSDDASPPASTD